MRQRQGANFCPFQRRRSSNAIAIDAPALVSHFCSLFNAGITDAPASGSRILPIPNTSAMGPNSAPPGWATPKSHKKMQCNEPPFPEAIFRFGVLQLRLHRFETIYFEVVASKVGYLNILQDRVCALFILQAKAVRIALL
jgi:hypothetical protein